MHSPQLYRIKAPSIVDLLVVLIGQQHKPPLPSLLTALRIRIPRPQHSTRWQQVFALRVALIG